MRIVVTGGAGFIGANLVRLLASDPAGHDVAVVDDLSTGSRDNLAGVKGIDFVEGTVVDPAVCDAVFDGADAIVHLAARPSVPRSIDDPVASHVANADGTLQVLEAARRAGKPHVVVASSSSVYGANPALPKHEDQATLPVSPYAATKLTTEAYTLAWGSSYDLPVLAFRFFNVFGPLQPAGHAYAAVIPAFVSAAIEDRPLPVHGDGEQTRDFTYVGSVTAVIADAVARGVTHEGPVNLAFGSRHSLLDVIARLEDILGRDLDVEHGPTRPGDVRHSQADASRLEALFPDVKRVGFDTGLRETVAWFETGALPGT